MLHAVIHNKKAQEGGDAWNLEDNITSTFFGPLRFMSADQSCMIIKKIFNIKISGDLKPDKVEFEFWPKFKRREPDMMIYFSAGGIRIKTILLEIKWEANQSGTKEEHQLKQQYDAYHNFYKKKYGEQQWGGEKERLAIIFLVLYESKAVKELADNNPPKHDVEIKTWNQIVYQLLRMDCFGIDHLELWRNDSVAYLSQLLGNIFHGFNDKIFDFQSNIDKEPVFFVMSK